MEANGSSGAARDAIVAALREIAALLRLTGSDPFRWKAYENGADAIAALDDLRARVEEGRLTEVSGIGKGLASVIGELHAGGRARILDRLREEAPPGAGELERVERMTLRRMRALHEALGIDSIASLRAACEAGRVREVRGFGPKTEKALLDAIARLEAPGPARMILVDALDAAERAMAAVRATGMVEAVAIAGDVRRGADVVEQIDLVATAPAVRAHAAEERAQASARAATAAAGVRVEVRVVAPEQVGVALVRATGSARHVAELEGRALVRGVDLDLLRTPREADVYAALGLPFIPPELREGDLAAADAGELARDLVAIGDVRGMVHCHTVYSDGRATIEEMAREADAMGMQYLTITDHSPAAHYAGGVGVERLERQWEEIARVQESVKVRLLRGTESDILADGALDYPDRVLEQLDVVIASVHGRMSMDEDAMTRRIVSAMRNPVFKVWGHPLGRLVLRRAPIACNVHAILDAVAESRAAIELNGDPYRLDLPHEWIGEARRRGIRFVVSVDAHSTRGMHNLGFGVTLARRGGLRPADVLNTLPAREFIRAVRPAA